MYSSKVVHISIAVFVFALILNGHITRASSFTLAGEKMRCALCDKVPQHLHPPFQNPRSMQGHGISTLALPHQ